MTIELSEARTARIVWTEVFDAKLDDAFQVLDEIGNRIVASIASEIEAIERNRAILKPPNSLDAWEAYHRGLWHMYRFNKADNDRAEHFFQMSGASIQRSHVLMPVCHSLTGRTPFSVGQSANTKATRRSRLRARASSPTIAIPQRIGPWGGRSGCEAAASSL